VAARFRRFWPKKKEKRKKRKKEKNNRPRESKSLKGWIRRFSSHDFGF
jgi:hypothetical protein